MIIFDVLGSMRVTGPQGPIHVQAPMQRRLLALFLAHAGQAVELDWAADQLWRGRPPKTARKTLIVYVHRLRRLMGLGDGLAYQPAGHTLNPAPGALDSWEFQSLGDEAAQAKRNGDPTRASELAEQALALWRGPAFADVRDLPAVEARARGLDEQRLNLIEEWADSELMLGRHVSLTGRLASTCAEYQYRERLQGLMMLALYRSGRPADALAHYRQTRQALAEELGIEPTVELDQLHRDILHNETSLAWRENRSTIVLSGRRFLPPCVPDFTGRVHELEWLNGSVVEPCGSTGPIDAAQIRAIVGMAGIGKTALAVHWAHSVAARFPDGQLYLDLRGYGVGNAMPSEEALAILLRAVGVPAECVPTDPGERAGLYRSTLAAKKMLILLDNAQSVEQVRPLLPASPDSLVLVTSRDAFTGLIARDGARRLMLDCLEPAHACTLVEAILGRDRVKTEPSAVQELAEACGFLPMALRIAAAHLVTEPQQTIASYVAQLNGGERAANLTIEGDPRSDLEAVFDHSYQTLPQSAQHMLRLLGLLSSTSFTIEAAGVLADVDFGESTEAVQRLVQANLVRDLGSGRFTLHNLIAAYAAARCRTSDPDHARRAARSRLLDWHVTRGLDPREG